MHRTMNVHVRPDTRVSAKVYSDGSPPYATVMVGPDMDDVTVFAWDPDWLRALAATALDAAVRLEAAQAQVPA